MTDFLKRIAAQFLNPRSRLESLRRPTQDQDASSNGSAPAGARGRLSCRDLITNLPLLIGFVVVVALFLLVLFGPIWAPENPYIGGQHIVPHYDVQKGEFISPPLPPSEEFPWGTDRWGNDLLSLLMHGARNTLVACAFITMVRLLLGLLLGGIAGWNEGGTADQIIMGVSGVIISVPMLISCMMLIFALDIRRGLPVFIVALAAVGWTEIAQYIRSEFLVLRKMPYIEGAWASGLSGLQIAVRHVLPNILPQLLVIAFLEMGAVMMLLGELGFVGVYIGGGSEFAVELDPFTVKIETVVEVPEWGAMLAEGFRWLRSRPYVVLPPAAAFFVAVVGFNALGEGLRRLIERASINTAFLLRKRMLLVFAAVSLATVFIVNNTGAAPWFAKVAGAFNGQAAFAHVQALSDMDGRGVGQAGGAAAAAYIADRFETYGLIPGGKAGSYIHPLQVRLVTPVEQPGLALLGGDGNPVQSFRHQLDFGYVIEGHGGGGQVEAPLAFVGFSRLPQDYGWQDFKGLDLRGRIVLLQQGNAPADFADEALIRGARGVLWVVGQGRDEVRSQIQLLDAAGASLRRPIIPIYRIRPAVADALLAQVGSRVAGLLLDEAPAEQAGPGWFVRDLDVRVRMSLALSQPQEIEIPCVLGYKQGSDYNLASEVVVLFAHYDGLGQEWDGVVFPAANRNASGVGMLLEIARLWQEQNLDSRRSVLFVAWGGAQLTDPGIEAYLATNSNYRHLSQLRTANPLEPVLIVQPENVAAGGDALVIHPGSDRRLTDLLIESAAALGIAPADALTDLPLPDDAVRLPEVGWLYFSWADADVPPDQDILARIDQARFQSLGEAVVFTLTKVVRETEY
ncbi:MAG: ABC transporter permease subunit [Chloroflexota bacterium]